MNFLKTFFSSLLAFVVGSVLVFFLWFFVLLALASSVEKRVAMPDRAVLKIDLAETIVDAPSSDPLAGIDLMTLTAQRQLPLLKVLQTLEAAALDDRIEGIYLRMGFNENIAGMALLEELRAALAEFKASGKFVVAYNENYSQAQYYLASVADAVYIQPEGGLSWYGVSSSTPFFKGLFDKLDLRAEVFRPTACRYKSAVEPFIRSDMSPENREQMQSVIDSMWETLSSQVCDDRGIDPAQMQRLTDDLAVALPDEALEYGFVDGVIYEDQMKEVFAELGAGEEPDFVTLGEYASAVGGAVKNFSADRVAVLYADGQIVDGEGSGAEIYGNSLAAQIADLRDDDRVKAVVVRVNSPGGSALASDVIWREMELLRAEKPVIVSMGSYAASGGYYISCPADAIVADRLTLTGSIGVYGMILDTRDALKNKLGVTFDGVQSNASADFMTTGPLTSVQRAMIMRGVDRVYDTFTKHVAAGRNLPLERVLEIAGGRVWSGEEALGIGLVDACGGLKSAIAVAVDKAGLGEDFRVVEVREQPSGLAAIFSSLNVSVRNALFRSEIDPLTRELQSLGEAARRQGILMYDPCRIDFR